MRYGGNGSFHNDCYGHLMLRSPVPTMRAVAPNTRVIHFSTALWTSSNERRITRRFLPAPPTSQRA